MIDFSPSEEHGHAGHAMLSLQILRDAFAHFPEMLTTPACARFGASASPSPGAACLIIISGRFLMRICFDDSRCRNAEWPKNRRQQCGLRQYVGESRRHLPMMVGRRDAGLEAAALVVDVGEDDAAI